MVRFGSLDVDRDVTNMTDPGPLSPETYLAQELSKQPFSYKFNAASFQHLPREEMLDVSKYLFSPVITDSC